ncbi:MAG: hypothetical protein ACON5F_08940 [Jejuia sp.]
MKNNILSLLTFFCALYCKNAHDIKVTNEGLNSEITITTNPKNYNEIVIASMRNGSPIIINTSNDGGKSWKQSAFAKGIADPVLTYGDNNTAYLTYLDFDKNMVMSLATSTDGGKNWQAKALQLDGKAADRQWIKRDNSKNSPYYGSLYLSYFHPEDGLDIHIIKVDKEGNVGENHKVHSTTYPYVQNPTLDVSIKGDIVICFVAGDKNGRRKIMAVHSTDGSKTFSKESLVSEIYMFKEGKHVSDVIGFGPGDANRLGNSLQMAIDKSKGPYSGRVYLTWTDFVKNKPEEGMNVLLSHSDNHGITWSTPMIVNDDNIASSHQYYSAIDVNPSGVVCLSWYDRRSDPANDVLTDFYFSHSTDGGATFQKSIKVNSETSDHTAVTNGLMTFGVGEYNALASNENEAYVVWADGRENNGDMNIYFAKVKLKKHQ